MNSVITGGQKRGVWKRRIEEEDGTGIKRRKFIAIVFFIVIASNEFCCFNSLLKDVLYSLKGFFSPEIHT